MAHPSVAIITGASRRFGLLACEYLLKHYDVVVALTRNSSEALDQLREQGLVIESCDQSDDQSVNVTIEAIRARYQRIDLILHNSSVFNKDPEDWRSVAQHLTHHHAVHVSSVAQLNFGLKDLLFDERKPGLIVHMTDIFADRPSAPFSLYCSTKAALESLTKSLAAKWGPGIRVMSIQPGPVKFLPSHTDGAKKAVLSETPLAREGGFEPLLKALDFVITNDFVTGSSVKVDGGRAVS